ncbi:MAG: glycosyl hydrolase family 28-related protein [Caldilineaceae bacterium]
MTQEPSNLPIHGLNVADYGATGNGEDDDSAAIQATLNAGAALVVIPYGVYKIGRTLRLSSYTRLLVHPQARLFLAPNAGVDNHTHLLTNQHHTDGDEEIHVEGGIWDGNNVANLRGPDRPDSYTGVLMNFTNVRGLTLRSLTVRDPESYFIRLGQVSSFDVGHIRFEAPHLRPNQDGVHLGGYCEDGYIHDLSAYGPGTPNDDVVALNADDANYRAQNLGQAVRPHPPHHRAQYPRRRLPHLRAYSQCGIAHRRHLDRRCARRLPRCRRQHGRLPRVPCAALRPQRSQPGRRRGAGVARHLA